MKTTLKVAAFCAAFALVNVWQSAQASTATLEVQVSGVPGWVAVKLNAWPKYGGRVVYESGRYVTDDVARGEKIRVTVTPDRGEPDIAYFGILCYDLNKWVLPDQFVPLPHSTTLVVPTNPAYDNNYIYVDSYDGAYLDRIPIGPRVR